MRHSIIVGRFQICDLEEGGRWPLQVGVIVTMWHCDVGGLSKISVKG